MQAPFRTIISPHCNRRARWNLDKQKSGRGLPWKMFLAGTAGVFKIYVSESKDELLPSTMRTVETV